MQLRIEPRPYADPDVQRMVAEVQAYYVEIYGGPDAAAVDEDEFALPSGRLLVGLVEDVPVAMGGWRRLLDGPAGPVAEIKRMYTSVAARRQGVGRRMLAAVEASAAAAGIAELVLNTGPHQHAAIALYEADGYRPTTPFGHYAGHGGALFLAKRLSADRTRP